jgi:hypothetical protein
LSLKICLGFGYFDVALITVFQLLIFLFDTELIGLFICAVY